MAEPISYNERDRCLKHALRQSFIERPPHTAAGERAQVLQDAANLRLAAGLVDKDGAGEMKRLAFKTLRKLNGVAP